MDPLAALRNANLNPAYQPRWQQPDYMNPVVVPQGNTQFDPFTGTGWSQWLDASGAGDPNGVKMQGGPSPTDSNQLRGLRSAMLNKPVGPPPMMVGDQQAAFNRQPKPARLSSGSMNTTPLAQG